MSNSKKANSSRKKSQSSKAKSTKKPVKKSSKKPATTFSKQEIADVEVEEDVQEELVDLYRGEDEADDVDMTTLDQGMPRRTGMVILFVIIVLLAAVAATMGFLVFGPDRSAVSDGEVELSIDAVTNVASGDQLTMVIEYANESASTIDVASIEVLYPAGFYLRSSDPQPVDNVGNTWHLSNISSGTSGSIELTGQLVGQVDESKTFTVLLNYRPLNFSSDFQETESVSIVLDESIIDLDTSLPERTRNGEEIQLAYEFTNEASLPLTNVKAFVEYPAGFTPESATPSADTSNHTWLIDEVDPGDTVEIVVKGTLEGESGSEHEFITQVGLQEPDGFFNVQAEAVDAIEVVNPEITMQLTAPEYGQAGQVIEYTIDIENTSQATIEDIELQIDFSGGALETSQISLTPVETLKPGKKKTVTQTVDVVDSLPEDATDITATLSIVSARVDGAEISFSETAETVTRLQSSVSFTAEARYYDDDLTLLGDGPLPPKVGSETEYVIRWTVAAAGGDIEDISIQTTLPDGISYVRGDERITHSGGTVTADLRNVKADAEKVLEFTVAVTPVKGDINKLLVLSSGAVMSATDSASNADVQLQTSQLTSKLSGDPGAEASDGAVVPKN